MFLYHLAMDYYEYTQNLVITVNLKYFPVQV